MMTLGMTLGAIVGLSVKSLLNRRLTVGLTVLALAISVLLMLGVEKLRQDAKLGFANTISGTDLIVGARSGSIQLLLYSVFRIGNATNNISWRSYREIAARPDVAWTVPISLGDSHRGFRVMGTTRDFFTRYRYADRRALAFAQGKPFDDLFETVLGAEVAESLGYEIGQQIVVAHGIGGAGFSKHEDKPFTVAGILARTGTPADRTVHVSLAAIEAIHLDWKGGARVPGMSVSAERARAMRLQPKTITAFMIGLKSRLGAFRALRAINEYRREPLLAILPGVALQELWGLMGTAETALGVISLFVVAGGLAGMLTMLLAGLNERRREMAILRAVGAGPRHLFAMFIAEAMVITAAGAALGLLLLQLGVLVARPWIESRYGLVLALGWPGMREWGLMGLVVLAGTLAGALPAVLAYRHALADGMTVRT